MRIVSIEGVVVKHVSTSACGLYHEQLFYDEYSNKLLTVHLSERKPGVKKTAIRLRGRYCLSNEDVFFADSFGFILKSSPACKRILKKFDDFMVSTE